MSRIRHSDVLLLAVVLLGGIALLLVVLGWANGGAPRIETAEAAEAAPAPLPPAREPGRPEPPSVDPGTAILTVRPGASVRLHDAPGGDVVARLGDTTGFGSPTVISVAERRRGWAGVPSEELPNGKLGWVELDDGLLATDRVGQSIVIDLSEMRAVLTRKGEVERHWTVGIGGPGTPTPTGHFSITDEIEGGLNPVYGCCAIALSATQPNLPPGWSGGNRIAIHGTSEPLGAANSTGCIHSSDADLRALIERVPLGTPVTIRR